MTVPNTTRSGVGFRHLRIFALDTSGYPAATSTAYYEGVRVEGAKAMTIDDPEPRDIVHTGDDSVVQRDILPPDTPISGEIRVAKTQDETDEILTDDEGYQVGEAMFFPFGTSNRGDQNQVGVLAYRQSLDTKSCATAFGKRYWEGRLFPKTYVIPREIGFEDSPEERPYSFRPLFVTTHLWGSAFSTDGCMQAQGERSISEFKPKIVAFQGDAAEVTFTYPTAEPPQSAAKIELWVDGVEQTTGFTATTQMIVFSAAPADGAMIVSFYEYE